ncbi:uncharacterized protein LOC129572158 [Sitodiplosis mosellana]|uniref:uncharacterized protein LOC129572158 n=1 Tax=Sitodiplosis mosellana TaxID=263140 RepID=UPI002443FB62|nr:uncharacterized protein LOC129572158 [Sitodiplosis mosellana]
MSLLDELFEMPKLQRESYENLRKMIDTTNSVTRQLRVLDSPVENWDQIIVHVLISRMPPRTLQAWEDQRDHQEMPELEEVMSFLAQRARSALNQEPSTSASNEGQHNSNQNSQNQASNSGRYTSTKPKQKFAQQAKDDSSKGVSCNNCQQPHPMHRCARFQALSVQERVKRVRALNLCSNCFSTNHRAGSLSCKAGPCKRCNKGANHNTLLCYTPIASTNAIMANNWQPPRADEQQNGATYQQRSATVAYQPPGNVVHYTQPNPNLGTSSQSYHMSTNLPKKKFSIQIEGVTGIEVASHTALIKISPWYEKNDENCLYKTCVVLKKLPVAQRMEFSADIPEFQSIIKADPNFNKAGFADILLGIDTWAEIIMDRVLRSSTGLCAQLTKFGYAIFGAINSTPRFTASVLCIGRAIMSGEESHRWDELLQKFWENEEIPSVEQILSESEQRAIDHYNKNTVRAENGQFIVRLPFIDDKVDFGKSREIALQRFYQLERRLERNQELRQKYNISMHEAIELGHMRLATAEERHTTGYYIPHHPITTRFRIVKDSSCATTNGKSINGVQLAGPNLQEKLAHVIMHLKYQKIFWRFNKHDPLQEYVWKTVLFGMKSSPFLAIYTVLELARIYENEFHSASRATKSERYMDDFMSGADSLQAVIKLYDELKQLMAKGNFDLSKWKTNSPKLLELINKDYNTDNQPLELNDDPTSVLGLKWQPNSDCFMFSTKV